MHDNIHRALKGPIRLGNNNACSWMALQGLNLLLLWFGSRKANILGVESSYARMCC